MALAVALAAGTVFAQGLPGGASSLNETHGDWTVVCGTAEGAVRCAITQSQVSGDNRQRILAIELVSSGGGNAATGVLMLPFGLRLESGAVLAVDDNPALPARKFSTCLPGGCLVPLDFDATAIAALAAGKALRVRTTAHDSGQEVAFSIALTGFNSALARITELTGP